MVPRSGPRFSKCCCGGRGEKMCGATVARVEVRSKVVWCHGQGNRGVKVCGAMIRVIEE